MRTQLCVVLALFGIAKAQEAPQQKFDRDEVWYLANTDKSEPDESDDGDCLSTDEFEEWFLDQCETVNTYNFDEGEADAFDPEGDLDIPEEICEFYWDTMEDYFDTYGEQLEGDDSDIIFQSSVIDWYDDETNGAPSYSEYGAVDFGTDSLLVWYGLWLDDFCDIADVDTEDADPECEQWYIDNAPEEEEVIVVDP